MFISNLSTCCHFPHSLLESVLECLLAISGFSFLFYTLPCYRSGWKPENLIFKNHLTGGFWFRVHQWARCRRFGSWKEGTIQLSSERSPGNISSESAPASWTFFRLYILLLISSFGMKVQLWLWQLLSVLSSFPGCNLHPWTLLSYILQQFLNYQIPCI